MTIYTYAEKPEVGTNWNEWALSPCIYIFTKDPFKRDGIKVKINIYTNAHYASIEYSMKEDVE